MKYKHLIFDIDGTLWDSRSIVARGYNRQLEKEGLTQYFVTEEDLRPLFGKIMTEIGDIIFADFPKPDRYELLERCFASEDRMLHEDPCNVDYPGVKETIAKLAEKHKLYIVSNSQCGYPELCMNKLGLQAYFQDHLCHGDTGLSKGKTIRVLMERNGIADDDVIYIGDTQGDYAATVEAGIPFIWCTFGFGTPDGYEAKIDNFEELLNL